MKRILMSVTTVIATVLIGSANIYAQDNPVIVQDNKLQNLVELKGELEKENKLSNGYTVQLHNGNLERAQQRKKDYDNWDYSWPASIHYETPNYKLWVGNFDTRLDADRALMILKDNFPSAFILKPDRR